MSNTNPDSFPNGRPVHGQNEHGSAVDHSSRAAALGTGHGSEGHDLNVPELPAMSGRAVAGVAATLVIVLGCAFAIGWVPSSRRASAARADAREAATAKPVVEVIHPKRAAGTTNLLLPADVRANQVTSVFARTNGYLEPLPPGIDIGARVKAGQVIARIAAPDLDAQLEQARASVAHARASVGAAESEHTLAVTTLQRYSNPGLTNAVAQQEIDTRRSQEQSTAAALAAARTNVGVAEAEVKRLEALQGFEQVTAPFDGVITMRNFDPGALISASDAPSGKPLFVIEQNDVLRVGVNVPQAYSTEVRPGTEAMLGVSNYPGRQFSGKVGRTAGSIDAATRTLRVEVDVPNPSGELLPGMYGQVKFVVKRATPPLIVPTSALSLGAEGERVAVLKDGRIHLQPVGLGRDYGTDIEVTEGLSLEDSIVNNPGTLPEGAEVETRAAGVAPGGK